MDARRETIRREGGMMARLAAAFGSSHSVMRAAELQDWLRGFRKSDLRMKYWDREGKPRSYADVLAAAPPNIGKLIAEDAITGRFNEVQDAMKRLKSEIASAKLDVLIIVGDDQHELFQDLHMPSMAIYYGESIRNAGRAHAQRFSWPEEWDNRAQMRRLEEDGAHDSPCHRPLALALIEALIDPQFNLPPVAAAPPTHPHGP